MNTENLTPAMKQYVDIKNQHKDCILLFRMGDFYETFFDDAKLCSKVLDLVLTSKNKGSENPIPMAGLPHHSAEKYIQKLVNHGYKVAIAEQTTEPKPGKIVEREVVSILTPGTYINESESIARVIVSLTETLTPQGASFHLAWGDFSLGKYWTTSVETFNELVKELQGIKPVELIIDAMVQFELKETLQQQFLVSQLDIHPNNEDFLMSILGVSTLDGYGKTLGEGRKNSVGLLFRYLLDTQKKSLDNIVSIAFVDHGEFVLFDETTKKNLEIFETNYDQSSKHSLYGVLDCCITNFGKRHFRGILSQPLKKINSIEKRLNLIQYFYENRDVIYDIQTVLKECYDVPKIISGLLYRKNVATQRSKLRNTLTVLLEGNILETLEKVGLEENLREKVIASYNMINKTIKENITQDDCDYIREHYDENVDILRKLVYHSDQTLLEYQQELVKKTGINSIKVKFITNQGYYLEISKLHSKEFENHAVREDEKFDFLRSGTLKTGERYTTPFLIELQKKIQSAKSELIKAEYIILDHLKDFLKTETQNLIEFIDIVAELDVVTSFANTAYQRAFCKPEFTKTNEIKIVRGRHAVVELFLAKDQHFIDNDLSIGEKELHIITGPNMGGKSTYLRQCALIVLLAHCGLRVPAESVHLHLVDGIFARIGTGDNIAKQQSTFMTEMVEVSNILRSATKNSFVILDELGRGTSTYDGLAITKSILEYMVRSIGCKTLIATHYHELIELEKNLPGVKNFSVGVFETDSEVVFMKKIVSGGASKSYGIDVAKLAGIQTEIIYKARRILEQFELQKKPEISPVSLFSEDLFTEKNKISNKKYDEIVEIINNIDVNETTPLKALEIISELKKAI